MENTAVDAKRLIQGTLQYLSQNGGGMIADVHNDAAEGTSQKWNQPFVSSSFSTQSVDSSAEEQLIRQAKTEGFEFAAKAKWVQIDASYGVEVNDAYEGQSEQREKAWNVNSVTDAQGKLLTAYMANDPKIVNVNGLQTAFSAPLPDYILKPSMKALDDVLAGRKNDIVEKDENGQRFKFFVNYVLQLGVPGHVRSSFEDELKALPNGPVTPEKATELAQRFSKVANAYTPEQWKRHFESRGLTATQFGARWK
jgi:hypothetical protein